MKGGSELLAAIGELLLNFVVGLVENLLAPIFQGIFGEPAE